MTCACGLPMRKNPHPDAGRLETLLTVGPQWVCIPCTVASRHAATARADQAEQDLERQRREREAHLVIQLGATVQTLRVVLGLPPGPPLKTLAAVTDELKALFIVIRDMRTTLDLFK